MARQNEHGRLIAAAAKAALAPIGCRRVGQSRLWCSDQRYWAIVIEFQPSGWEKGSYLNVGAMWLWYPKSGWNFDVGYRVEEAGFISFQSVDQFAPLITGMAARAALEVLALREKFKSLRNIYRHLVSHSGREGAPTYHAAVAAALIGDMTIARRLFHRLEVWPTHGHEWQIGLKSRSAALAALLDDPVRFRGAILAIVEDLRSRLNLPRDPECLESMDSITGG